MSFSAIVLAAGSGSRMRSALPKQYMPLEGKPVLYYSLKAFQESPVDEIVLVVPHGDKEYALKEIVCRFGFDKVHSIVEGQDTRSGSVLNGIRSAKSDYVLIHDSARAFVTGELIKKMMDAAVTFKAAAAAVPEKNTIKTADRDGYVTSTPDRSSLWEIQTPQSFDKALLLEGYEKTSGLPSEKITDDAMVVELSGLSKVKLVMGEYTNIKITTPEDLEIGRMILKNRLTS